MQKKLTVMVVLLLLFTNVLTFQLAGLYYRSEDEAEPPPAPTYDTDSEELAAFLEVLNILTERYLEEVTAEELLDEAIRGMVESLDDPQTGYMDAKSWEEIMIKTTGSFSGIGIEISDVENYITIVSPIRGTPGERAGLKAGDKIITVDGQDIVGSSVMDAVRLLRGPNGSSVSLEVKREGVKEPLAFKIIREDIHLPTVFSKILADDVGYIEIANFDNSTGEDFKISLMELENKGILGLVLDLRNNPGGLLSEAVEVAREVLPPGVITYMVDRNGEVVSTYRSHGIKRSYPIVVLVNEGSASAAEIIAGAMQDSGTALLVGTGTFGKGTVQSLERLSNGGGLRFTMAKYLTPDKRDIHGKGLKPDVSVQLPDIFFIQHHPLPEKLKKNDKGDAVTYLQQMLLAVGADLKDTGVFDDNTAEAVLFFQRLQGLPETGEADKVTLQKLQKEVEETLKRSDAQLQKALEIIAEKINAEEKR